MNTLDAMAYIADGDIDGITVETHKHVRTCRIWLTRGSNTSPNGWSVDLLTNGAGKPLLVDDLYAADATIRRLGWKTSYTVDTTGANYT